MQQFESVMFKGRPFPEEDPVMGVPFLLELTTFVLSGRHDIDRMDGPITRCKHTHLSQRHLRP